MPIELAASLLDALRQGRLLDANQLTELVSLLPRFPDARALAKELLQRGWLTAYQINQLFQGKGDELVLGQYLILERIGEGGMGQVFKARQQRMNRLVALKVIRKDRLGSSETVRRFQREVLAAAQLSHPNVVTAYDADQVGNVHFFAMEFVEGTDLSKLIREYGPLPIPLASNYILQAAQGLQHAFEKGMVHRDIKPSNLLVSWGSSRTAKTASGTAATGRPVVKILDMGLARLSEAEDGMTSELTQEGAVMGTVDYLAPEQALNSRLADIRSDMYSLGCTFYFLLTGQVPFPGGTATEKLLKHRLDEPLPVEQIRPEIPRSLGNVVRKMMAKQPADRYQTPAELVEVLSAPLGSFITAASVNGTLGAASLGTRAMAPVAVLVTNYTGTPAAVAVPVTHVEEETQTSALLRKLIRKQGLLLGTKGKWAVAGAGAGLLLALLLVVILWTRSGKRTVPIGPLPPPEQASEADLQRLKSRLATVDPNQARRFLLAVQQTQLGKARALQAAELVPLLPSALDSLNRDRVTAADRVIGGSPEGLVAVFGDQRLRQWGNLPSFNLINSLALSPDGKLAAGGGWDGALRLWDTATGQQRRAIPCEGRIVRVDFLLGGKRLLAVDESNRWKWFDTSSGAAVPVLPGWFRAVSADGSTLLTVDDERARTWDTATGRELASFRGHGKDLRYAALSDHGQLVASVGSEPAIMVWNSASGKLRATLKSPSLGSVSGLRFAAHGKLLASGDSSNKGTVRLWDVSTEKERGNIPNVMAAWSISGDGRTVVTVGHDTVTRLSSGLTGQEITRLPLGPYWPALVKFSPDGRLLVTASGGNDTVKVWEAATGKPRVALQGLNSGQASALSFAADGKTLAAGRSDGRIDVWETASGISRLPSRENSYTDVGISHDAATLALVSGNHVHLVASAGAKERFRLTEHRDIITGLAFSPDDQTLATASRDGTAKLWDVASGQIQATLSHHQHGVSYVRFTPDGRTVVSVDQSHLKFWDAANGQPKKDIELRREDTVTAAAMSPDGRQLATGTSERGAVLLWDVAGGKERSSLALAKETVWPLGWTPDSRVLAVRGGQQGNIKLCDMAANKQMPTVLNGNVLAFSPDSRSIILASGEGQLRMCDLTTGQVALPLEGHSRAINSIGCSADGRLIASADMGGRVIVWEPASRRRKLQQWQLPGAVQRVMLAPDNRHLLTVNSNGSVYILRFALPTR